MRSSVRRTDPSPRCGRHNCGGTSSNPGTAASPPGHILGDAGLSDFDAELEKLAMNSWRSPQWIGDTHLADQLAYFQRHRRPSPRGLDLQRQYDLNPARFQRITVSGFKIARAP